MRKTKWEKGRIAGGIGEATVMPLLFMPVECWRGSGNCHRWQDVEYLAQAGKVDADVLISFSCGGCPMLGADLLPAAQQLHEIKTNVAANDAAITGKSERTQNLYIELIQNLDKYCTGDMWSEDDPLSEGGFIVYRAGIGWWRKREYAVEKGRTTVDKAEWYHFYQPVDMWERVGLKREKVKKYLEIDRYGHYQLEKKRVSIPKRYKKATKAQVNKWLADDKIADDAILITQMPVEYCISIRGERLKELVAEIEANKTTDNTYTKNGYDMGYKIPIKDVVPCVAGKLNREWGAIETAGLNGVKINLIAEYVRRGSDKRIKGILPEAVSAYYVPRAIRGTHKEGAIALQMGAYQNDSTGEFYIPKAVIEFEALWLQEY